MTKLGVQLVFGKDPVQRAAWLPPLVETYAKHGWPLDTFAIDLEKQPLSLECLGECQDSCRLSAS